MFAVSRWIESVVYPQIVFLQIIPKIAIAPLFMIWFGYGLTSKVLIVFLLSFFPVVVSAVQAFRSVDPDMMDLARDHGRASRCACSCSVQIPHALPTMFTGFKVAAALAATAAVVAEFVVVRSRARLSSRRLHQPLRHAGRLRRDPRAERHGTAALRERRGHRARLDSLACVATQCGHQRRHRDVMTKRNQRRKRMKWTTLLLALFTAMLASTAHAQDKVTLRLNWLLYGFHTPFYLGVERGYYKDEKHRPHDR